MPLLRRPPVLAAAVVAAMVITTGCSSTIPETLDQATANEVGSRLVTGYYNTLSCGSEGTEAYETLLDNAFQSVTATGTKTKDEVIAVMDAICFEEPQISDIKVTVAPGTLVVSYKAGISRDGVPQAPTNQVNVYVDKDGKWVGVAYADAGLPAN